MATTSSISSSYERLGGRVGAPEIKISGQSGPVSEEWLAEQERKRLAAMTPFELAEEMGKRYQSQLKRNDEAAQRMQNPSALPIPNLKSAKSNMSAYDFRPALSR